MNDQLQGKLVEILSAIQAGARAAGDFAMEQLPDIAQQYVLYGRVVSTAYVVMFALLAICCVATVVMHARGKEDLLDCEPAIVIFGPIGGALSAAIAFVNFGPAMLVWFAPKVWLLKELAGLIK